MIKALCVTIIGSFTAMACSGNPCPRSLTGRPDPDESSIVWGGSNRLAEATIASVAVECLPSHDPPADTLSRRFYDLIVTASIAIHVVDTTASRWSSGRPSAQVAFEAVSARGVVLDYSYSNRVEVVRGVTRYTTTVTDRITGLTPDEVRHVDHVRARWLY